MEPDATCKTCPNYKRAEIWKRSENVHGHCMKDMPERRHNVLDDDWCGEHPKRKEHDDGA